jgi:hypothetical protein
MLARKLLVHTTCTIVFGVRAFSTHQFWILRHGETDANAGGLIQGSSDFSPLTSKGKEQASLLAETETVRVEFSHVNSIYVSPLTRARETLDVLRDLNVHLSEEVVLDNLRVIDLYAWQGRDKEYLKSTYPHSYNAWKLGDPHNFIVPSFSDHSERYLTRCNFTSKPNDGGGNGKIHPIGCTLKMRLDTEHVKGHFSNAW